MTCAITIECVEPGPRATRIIDELNAGEPLRFDRFDTIPFLYQGDDVDDGRRVAEQRLASIDPAWHEVVRVL